MVGLPGWVVVLIVSVVAAAVLVGLWCWWTAGRLDRMHLRVEAARASLQTQLQHRASVATELAIGALGDPASAVLLLETARAAREGEGEGAEQWIAESELTAVLRALDLPGRGDEPLVGELFDAARKAAMARRIHNDVAATTQQLHRRRRVRWFHLAGRAAVPAMIDFDDRGPLQGSDM
ncbi:MAG: hypothetical protein WKF54_06060 [Nocardioidaceae bacterium]